MAIAKTPSEKASSRAVPFNSSCVGGAGCTAEFYIKDGGREAWRQGKNRNHSNCLRKDASCCFRSEISCWSAVTFCSRSVTRSTGGGRGTDAAVEGNAITDLAVGGAVRADSSGVVTSPEKRCAYLASFVPGWRGRSFTSGGSRSIKWRR